MKKCLFLLIVCVLRVGSAFAADTETLYDGLYGRPSYFQDFEIPTTWPNNMTYYVTAVDDSGKRLVNYEVAVFDQDNKLRAIGRSIAQQQDLCPLTILGTEGDEFRFAVLSGDFSNPQIRECKQKVSFLTNYAIMPQEALQLTPEPANLKLVKLNASGFATISYGEVLSIGTNGITACKAKVDNGNVILTSLKGKAIPADAAVMLYGKGMEDSYVFLKANNPEVICDITGNELRSTTGTSVPTDGFTYLLGDANEFLTFDGYAFKDNQAYLNLSKAYASLTIVTPDETDGIANPVSHTRYGTIKYIDKGSIRIRKPDGTIYTNTGILINK